MREMQEQGWKERTVTVSTYTLLIKLKENLKKHKDEYEKAVIGYKEMAAKRLKQELTAASSRLEKNFRMLEKRIDEFDPDEQNNTVVLLDTVHFKMMVPQDHSKAYEVAIQMAEWEENKTIDLLQSQFQCFVMDDWEWKNEFESVTKRYLSR
jgi:hypothetical protein